MATTRKRDTWGSRLGIIMAVAHLPNLELAQDLFVKIIEEAR